MVISQAEAVRRLSSPNNLLSQLTQPRRVEILERVPGAEGEATSSTSTEEEAGVDSSVRFLSTKKPGRGPSLSEEIRDEIASAAMVPGVTQDRVAAAYGVSQQTVSDCVTGRVGGRPATAERKAKVQERIGAARDTAMDKLMMSLGLILEEDMKLLKPKELTKIAKDMASIHQSLTEKNVAPGSNVQIVIMSPPQKDVADYKIIDV